MAEQRELIKVLVQAVVLRREGDSIVGEAITDPVACYGPEELTAFWARASGEVSAFNAAAGEPPRRQRRRETK